MPLVFLIPATQAVFKRMQRIMNAPFARAWPKLQVLYQKRSQCCYFWYRPSRWPIAILCHSFVLFVRHAKL